MYAYINIRQLHSDRSQEAAERGSTDLYGDSQQWRVDVVFLAFPESHISTMHTSSACLNDYMFTNIAVRLMQHSRLYLAVKPGLDVPHLQPAKLH